MDSIKQDRRSEEPGSAHRQNRLGLRGKILLGLAILMAIEGLAVFFYFLLTGA
ncbi:hypothetical protein [Desulfolithobacter sp.]